MSDTDIEELLDLLQEEGSEVAIACSKATRFGLDNTNPYEAEPRKTNREKLVDEIGDVFVLVDILAELGVVDMERIKTRVVWKRGKLRERGLPGA